LTRHPGFTGSTTGATGNVQSGANANATAAPNARTNAQGFRFNGREFRGAPPGFRATNNPNPARALRNQTFANPAATGGRNSLANTTFRGRFAAARAGARDPRWREHHHFWHGRVIGWYGPTFWPYAYYDMFDYAFWPYAYDTFWPYAYDDLYGGIFGPYAYGYDQGPPPPVAEAPPADGVTTGSVADREAQVCSEQASVLTNWPIQHIAETVQPDAQQKAALDRLGTATNRAVQILQAACPTELPSTPTGRLAVLQTRLNAMLRAVDTIAPALKSFYESLTEEQRARFDSLGQQQEKEEAANEDSKDLAQACGEQNAGLVLPIDRIQQEVHPEGRQQEALDNLSNASARAAEILKSNCPTEAALSAVGRIDAMRQRLSTMLDAVNTVRPALDAFYGSLSYEQRARFNVIGAQEG